MDVFWFSAGLLQWLLSNMETSLTLAAVVFAAWQVRQAASAFRASTLSQVTTRSEELQWRVLQDPELREIITGTSAATTEQRQRVAAGLVINHFATMFDLHRLGALPRDAWEPLRVDMMETLRKPLFKERWDHLKKWHGPAFVGYLDGLINSDDK